MDLSNPFVIDAIWLSIAFLCGLITKRIGLPPLVGFLAAGFVINFSGLHAGNLNSAIEILADIGVMILLFTIGLKLKLKELFRPEIWATASINMILSILALSGVLMLMMFLGISLFADLSLESTLVLSFAMSFSSTVFVVKALEAKGEFDSYHGKIAIGILIIQDIIAVLFIAFSDKAIPSLWVFALPLFLWIIKWLMSQLLNRMEHGELFSFFGFFATFVLGAFSFSLFGLKADLGALVIGMLLVNHPRADELYKRMAEYKDFFLIAFFVNVGLVGLPGYATLIAAAVLLPVVLFKGFAFLVVLSRFSLQPRTAFLSSMALTNFSEFGLIVGVVGFHIELISNDWIVTLSLLMSLSFVLAAPLNANSHVIFDRFKTFILKLNKNKNTLDKEPADFGHAKILVAGLGSIGMPSYLELSQKYGNCVLGLDYNRELIDNLKGQGYNVEWADTTDSEIWDNVDCSLIHSIFLCFSDFNSNVNTLLEINRMKNKPFRIFAISHYTDHGMKYNELGVDFVFEYKANLGKDFVNNSLGHIPA